MAPSTISVYSASDLTNGDGQKRGIGSASNDLFNCQWQSPKSCKAIADTDHVIRMTQPNSYWQWKAAQVGTIQLDNRTLIKSSVSQAEYKCE